MFNHYKHIRILSISRTTRAQKNFRPQTYRQTFTNYKQANWTQVTKDTELAFSQTTIPDNIHTANRNSIFTNIILLADKHNILKLKMPNVFSFLPGHIVCKITQQDNVRRANSCDLSLKLLNSEITSEVSLDKQNFKVITGTTHTLYGRLFMVFPIELHPHHKTAP